MKKLLFILIVILLLIVLIFSYLVFGKTIQSKQNAIFITDNTSMQLLEKQLLTNDIIDNRFIFSTVSKLLKFKTPKPGKYDLEKVGSMYQLVKKLRAGDQDPIQFTILKFRSLDQIAGYCGKKLMNDSATFATYFDTEALAVYGIKKEELLGYFIPNTYEMWWNTSPEKFLKRIIAERDKFWNKSRLNALSKLNLTINEATTIASIVDEETIRKDEKPTIAGVYLNRVTKGMPLEADPTVKFAVGDFMLKRILQKHLQVNSPYNTYMYPGIPPGPICTPSQESIDAVLNYEHHSYLYFCARPDFSGYHNFASNSIQHANNAKLYHQFLNKLNIK